MSPMPQGTIAPTDYDWCAFLQSRAHLDEVNFWKPSAERAFRGNPLTPFFFKLKAPHRAVCGFGFFVRYASLPDWMAWECFGEGNRLRADFANGRSYYPLHSRPLQLPRSPSERPDPELLAWHRQHRFLG